MERQHVGASEGIVQMGSSQAPAPQQVTASQTSESKQRSFAAFGTSGGAAFVIRDLASI